MDETKNELSKWEFASMVDAAAYSILDEDTQRPNFEEAVWQVYCIIERRISVAEYTIPRGVPEHHKEDIVKQIATERSEGFTNIHRKNRAIEHLNTLPIKSTNRFQNKTRYQPVTRMDRGD